MSENIFLKWIFANYLFFHLIIWVRFLYVHLTAQIFILNNLFCLFMFLWFLTNIFLYFFIDFDGYYIVGTDEGQPGPKYIFNKCGTNIYFFTLQRFGPSPSPNFKVKNMFLRNTKTLKNQILKLEDNQLKGDEQ